MLYRVYETFSQQPLRIPSEVCGKARLGCGAGLGYAYLLFVFLERSTTTETPMYQIPPALRLYPTWSFLPLVVKMPA